MVIFVVPLPLLSLLRKVIFFHKASKTLLVTDCVICIPRDPPPIVAVEGLLQAAADEGEPPAPDSPESRRQVGLQPPLMWHRRVAARITCSRLC